jgi:hypothetical protein
MPLSVVRRWPGRVTTCAPNRGGRRRWAAAPGIFKLYIGSADGNEIAEEFFGTVSSKEEVRIDPGNELASMRRRKSIGYSFRS